MTIVILFVVFHSRRRRQPRCALYSVKMAASDDGTLLSDVMALNPSVESRLFLTDDTDDALTLPRALQPLLGHTDWLTIQIQGSLQNAETQYFMSGDLTKHELAAIFLLIDRKDSKECFNRVLQQKITSRNPSEIHPFLSYLRLVTKALRKLPTIGGNVWHVVSRDVSELYPVGFVFTWNGFPKCCYSFQTLDSVFESVSQENRTLFNILSANGRIVGQLSDSTSFPHVLLMPGVYYQVTSVTKADDKSTVVHIKEIISPRDNDGSAAPQYPQTVSIPSFHPYWTQVFTDATSNRAVAKFVRVLDIALATGDITLQTTCMRVLAEMSKLNCSELEKQKLLMLVRRVLKMYTAFGALQTHGCAVLKLLAPNRNVCGFSDPESVSLVVRAMQNHVRAERLISNGLEYLTLCLHDSEDVIICQKLVDVVLASMKNHPGIRGIQKAGCVVIKSLCKATHCASLMRESDGFSVVMNAIRVHRGDRESSEICWQALLTLSDKNNNNNSSNNCSSQDEHVRNRVDFWCLVKEGLALFDKRTPVQVEGLHTIWSHVRAWAEVDSAHDPDYSELVTSALRHHSQNAQVVECALGILSELTKRPSETHLAVSNGVIARVLSAMNQHFDEAPVQEYGCKVLRIVATNGIRPYQQDSKSVTSHDSAFGVLPESLTEALPDYRLKIIESGGMGIVLSAMKTHSHHVGVQRQGCLAIRTLSVSAANVVETEGVEEIGVVLGALSKHTDSVSLVTAALRAIVILTIKPGTRRTILEGGGLSTILYALKSFPNCVRIQEEGLEVVNTLTDDTKHAQQLLRKGFVKEVIFSIERHPHNGRILTSCCSLLAKLCSAPLEDGDTLDMLPTVALAERGGFDAIDRIMAEFPSDAELQIQGCLALHALAVNPVNTSMLSESAGLTSVITAMKSHPANTALFTEACRTLVKLIQFRDKDEAPVTTEAIDQVFSAMATHPEDLGIQMEGMKALQAVMENDASRLIHISNSDVMTLIVLAMRQFPTELSLQVLCLQILNDLLCFERNGSTPWQKLMAVAFWLMDRVRPLWNEFCSHGGLDTLLHTMKDHVTSRTVLMFGGNILLCNSGGDLPTSLHKPLLDLCEEIQSSVSPSDERLHLLFKMVKHLVR